MNKEKTLKIQELVQKFQDSCQPVRGCTHTSCDKWPWRSCAAHQTTTSQMVTLPTDTPTPSRARHGSNGGSTPPTGTIFDNLKYFVFCF
jgi:hypothetical protein|nr:MAG TPA: hypothetical protein [Caudoviricetes sp.]